MIARKQSGGVVVEVAIDTGVQVVSA